MKLSVEERRETVKQLKTENPNITNAELAQKFEVDEAQIRRDLKSLIGLQNIEISQIQIKGERRSIDRAKVKELADSIEELGLLNPITITEDKILIAGEHRLEAFKLLGRTEIPSILLGLSGLKAELAEIDENLIRNELHYIDRGEQLKRRKEIYEEMHPETKTGGDRKSEKIKTRIPGFEKLSFVADTVAKTGKCKTVIEDELRITDKIIPEVKEIIKAKAISKTNALKIAHMKPEVQKQYIENFVTAKDLQDKLLARDIIPEAKEIIKAKDINRTDALKMARMKPEVQKQVVDKLESGEAKGFIQAVQKVQREQIKTQEISIPEGKYNVLLIDPPWRYEFAETETRAIENQYPTMDLEDIKKLEVPADNDSVLLLWATAPKLEEALEVMNAWGFKYRTCAVWDKEVIGMGYWFRSQHELLLVGIKGKFRTPDPENRFSSVVREKRGKHSKKPEIVYDMIEKMFPNGKYLEIFARQKHSDKWDVWGNQL